MSDLPTEKDTSSREKTEMEEDLSELLDDALKDFDQQPSCSFKTSKNGYKGAKSSIPNHKSKSIIDKNKEQLNESRTTKENSLFVSGSKSGSNENKIQPNSLNSSNNIPSEKELEDMFNDLMKSASMEQGGQASNADVQNVLPMMENMMQSLLSFEILYPPLKELCNKYPDWLAENRQSLKLSDYENYNKQFEVTLLLCQEFENHQKSKDSKTMRSVDVDQKHFEKVFDLMQRMQSYGNPPADIVGEFAAIPNGSNGINIQHEEERFKSFLAQNGLDINGKGVQYDANGLPILPQGFSGNEEQCIIS